jgi:RNA polymerase sigma factor (sigma-70 family)
MATRTDDRLIEHIRRLVLSGRDLTISDGDLLGRFVRWRDDAAFEALVRRHGPMVFGVCCRVLRRPQDAEDAFQATFLVLARKAAQVAPPEMLGNWLYGVAYQTAIRARATIGKRNQRERQVSVMPETPILMAERNDDLWRLLDQEVSRLPDKYRAPIVLCDLEGKTRQEAARHLGWPEGSVAGRLARGREMLAVRLAKHGPTLSVGALAAELAQNAASACVPPSVMVETIQAASLFAAGQTAATAGISIKAAALAEGVIRTMNATKWATTILAIFVLAGLGGGLGLGLQGGALAPQEKAVAGIDQPNGKVAEVAAPMTDKERIIGVWRVKATEFLGSEGANSAMPLVRHTFAKDGRWTYSIILPPLHDLNNVTTTTGTYDFVGPGRIDLSADGFNPNGKVTYAIYRFDGDNRLTLCLSSIHREWGDKTRPTEFTTDKADWRVIWHLVRAKPGEEKPTQQDLDYSWSDWQENGSRPREERPPGLASRENLRKIVLAFHSYFDEHRVLPAQAIYSADGKTPLLSWRVAILPYLGKRDLYELFKLDEPWDSEHNKKLIPKMPNRYASTVAGKGEPGKTFYQFVTGPDTLFDGAKKMRLRDVVDGSRNTLLAIEAKDSVIWTRPADLTLPEDRDKRPPVGELFANGFNASFLDGSARFLSATIPAAKLRALVTPRGQEVVNIDSLTAPTKD